MRKGKHVTLWGEEGLTASHDSRGVEDGSQQQVTDTGETPENSSRDVHI